MNSRECLSLLIARCVVLICYYHRGSESRPDKTEMIAELGWLAADARRWGLRPEVVAAGVLAELRRVHDASIAMGLIGELEEAFGLVHAMA